jgi:hypothetical protein
LWEFMLRQAHDLQRGLRIVDADHDRICFSRA